MSELFLWPPSFTRVVEGGGFGACGSAVALTLHRARAVWGGVAPALLAAGVRRHCTLLLRSALGSGLGGLAVGEGRRRHMRRGPGSGCRWLFCPLVFW